MILKLAVTFRKGHFALASLAIYWSHFCTGCSSRSNQKCQQNEGQEGYGEQSRVSPCIKSPRIPIVLGLGVLSSGLPRAHGEQSGSWGNARGKHSGRWSGSHVVSNEPLLLPPWETEHWARWTSVRAASTSLPVTICSQFPTVWQPRLTSPCYP